MNRYSNAMSTIPISESISSTTKPSGSIRIPWQPLTGNYVDSNAPSSYYSVPDCIQFRFKAKQPTSAISQFTQSLLVKGDLYNGTADFGISLAYSGSQSGSFSGSVLQAFVGSPLLLSLDQVVYRRDIFRITSEQYRDTLYTQTYQL